MAELFFGEFRFDTRGLLLEGPAGSVEVRPKTLQLLTYLIEHRNRFVPRDELLEAVWPDVTVTRASLTQAVSELRQALGDDAREPRYVETRIKLGYRFVAPVYHRPTEQLELLPPPPGVGPSRRSRRWTWLAAAAVTLALAAVAHTVLTRAPPPVTVAVVLGNVVDGSQSAALALEEIATSVRAQLELRGITLAVDHETSHNLVVTCRELPGLMLELDARLETARNGARVWGWTWMMPSDGDPAAQAALAAPRIAEEIAAALSS